MWVCDKRLYRTKKGKIVEEGDARATDGAVLVATPGMVFPEKPIIERPETKAVKPVEDKAVHPKEDKGIGSSEKRRLMRKEVESSESTSHNDSESLLPPMPELADEED